MLKLNFPDVPDVPDISDYSGNQVSWPLFPRWRKGEIDSFLLDGISNLMENIPTDVEFRLAVRLRALRAHHELTLEALADRSGVSRSMISLIERGESSPTASVLDKLAAGLGVTLASLFADEARQDAAPLAKRADQRVWRDPATGYVRRNLSPAGFPSPIELVEVTLPAGAEVAYDTPFRAAPVDQQVFVLDGAVELRVGDKIYPLATGDCLAMRIESFTAFRNPGGHAARYLVALAAATRPR
jgi:transcriptional regulator with XRE-family HTH domain